MTHDTVEFVVAVANLADADDYAANQLLTYAAGLTENIEYSTHAVPLRMTDSGEIVSWEVTVTADLERHHDR